MFAGRFQPGLISQSTVFFSHNKPTLASSEINQRTGRLTMQKFKGKKIPPHAMAPNSQSNKLNYGSNLD